MYDDGYIPPMSPEDFAALAGFAGPLYQQSKTIESYTADGPGIRDAGSTHIRQGLEQAKQLAQAAALRQQQAMYVPPADPVFLSEVPYEPPVQQLPPTYPFPVPVAPIQQVPLQFIPAPQQDNQLEFSFEKREQQVTNDLLKEISVKLTKLLKILEPEGLDKPERQATIPKSNPTPKHVRPTQTKQTST